MNLSILIVYLFVQFLICLYISRRIQSNTDYFVAGRNLPLVMVAISLFATWFGAETCIGSSAAVFDEGLSGSRADPFGYSLCLVFSGLLIAPRIWNTRYTTLADMYRERFGKRTEQIAIGILALSSLIWAAAQLRAFSQVVAATTELPVDLTLFIAFVFVVAYTLMGGLLGDIITDVVQAGVIAVGLIFLAFYTVNSVDEGLWDIVQRQSPERLSFLGAGESWLQRIDRWSIPILGSLVAQEIVGRILAARSASVARRACLLSAGIYLVLGGIPVLIGLAGPELMNFQGESEQFLIAYAKHAMPTLMVPIFAGALISALLATIDSILLSVSALISNGLLIPWLKIREPRRQLAVSRYVVLGAGIVAYVMAVYSESIYDLLETASSFGTSGVLVITLFGLWTAWGGAKASVAALAVGLVATPIAEYGLSLESPFLVSLICSAATYVGLAGLKPRAAAS